MDPVNRHDVAEISFTVELDSDTAPDAVEIDAVVRSPDGAAVRVPCFWAGGSTWKLRYSSNVPGRHAYELEARDSAIRTMAEPAGDIEVADAPSVSPLHARGPIRLTEDRRGFRHADGSPFFWLADSWWFGMSDRLRFPAEFRELARLRAEQGFTVIQFAAGLACDIPPFDPREANDAGHAWTADFAAINPAYFDRVDERLEALIDAGLVPNLVGMWGYYLPFMGVDRARRHWRYLVARYAAYPVVFTLCGESRLIWYGEPGDGEAKLARRIEQTEGWAEVARDLAAIEPFGRLRTVHPGPASWPRRIEPLPDMDAIDFVFIQPGHSDHDAVRRAAEQLAEQRRRYADRPVLVGECCFEGMHGGAGAKVQRQLFWSQVLSGAPGYSYGADGIWQFNREDDPFGPSPLGHVWGTTPWAEAARWDGAAGLGIGRRILERFDWPRLAPRPAGLDRAADAEHPLEPWIAGIPAELRLVYFPTIHAPWSPTRYIRDLEPDVRYHAAWHNPLTGERVPIGPVQPDDAGRWPIPPAPILHDWLLALEAENA